MKIRIKGNAVRYRLSKSDITAFSENGYLQESTGFGDAELVYALQKAGDVQSVRADFKNGKITVYMPAAWAEEWTGTERVGFDGHMPLPQGSLYLLLEKDFKCLDETVEDQSDNYDNPLAR